MVTHVRGCLRFEPVRWCRCRLPDIYGSLSFGACVSLQGTAAKCFSQCAVCGRVGGGVMLPTKRSSLLSGIYAGAMLFFHNFSCKPVNRVWQFSPTVWQRHSRCLWVLPAAIHQRVGSSFVEGPCHKPSHFHHWEGMMTVSTATNRSLKDWNHGQYRDTEVHPLLI